MMICNQVEGIFIEDVVFIEDKVEKTLSRLNNLKKWCAKDRFKYIRDHGIALLQKQLRFLLKVQALKEIAGLINSDNDEDMGGEAC